MTTRGRKIVLAASDSESSEYRRSTWRQMLLATLPSRFVRFPYYMADINWKNETRPDGQAAYVPNGLRVVESLGAIVGGVCHVLKSATRIIGPLDL